MSEMNRMFTASNPYQGKGKKVLCVCSAGLLRSPTAAIVLANDPFNFNTRSAGIVQHYALIPVDKVLLHWADEIVCMTKEHEEELQRLTDKPIRNLNIPDDFEYRDPILMEMIRTRYLEKNS